MIMLRAFIAVSLKPNSNIRQLMESVKEIRGSKVIGGTETHITLSFLGEVSENDVKSFCRMLSGISFNRFEINAENIGGFPNTRKARVAYIGVRSEKLRNLHEIVMKGLPERFAESREFIPHLTISRFKLPADLSTLVSENGSRDFGTYMIDKVSLYRSDLKPDGAVYTEMCRAQLM